MKLFLDDIRNPPDASFTVVRTYEEFTKYVDINFENITEIWFDHDLQDFKSGREFTGFEALKYYVHFVVELDRCFVKRVVFHTYNPVGRERMMKYAHDFLDQYGVVIEVAHA